MATATVTFSQFKPNVNAVHTGINWTGGHLSRSVTLSPSGRLKMCRVPDQAVLTDFWLRTQNAADDNQQTWQIGTSATRSGIMSITTVTQTYSFSASISLDTLTLQIIGDSNNGTIRAPGGTRNDITGALTDLMPVKISLSDDAEPQSVWVIGTIGGGISASAFFTFMLFYSNDGGAGRTTIR
jgi:hypothetical protein